MASDGCGGVLDCGTCPAGQICGGGCVGAKPNVCGSNGCCPKTCQELGFNCGMAGDGCSGVINCGTCPAGGPCGPQVCGYNQPNVCGGAQCCPKTCAEQGFDCGLASDGCGGIINCGVCGPCEVCGLDKPNVCFAQGCCGQTCAQLGAQCGMIGDGCGGILDCGTCPGGPCVTCGGGGMPNVCGAPPCFPNTCADQGFNCGMASDGCCNLINCGTCPMGQTCGANKPNVCG
jgi:hypothetical protein